VKREDVCVEGSSPLGCGPTHVVFVESSAEGIVFSWIAFRLLIIVLIISCTTFSDTAFFCTTRLEAIQLNTVPSGSGRSTPLFHLVTFLNGSIWIMICLKTFISRAETSSNHENCNLIATKS
jgi:hypothetical protein